MKNAAVALIMSQSGGSTFQKNLSVNRERRSRTKRSA